MLFFDFLYLKMKFKLLFSGILLLFFFLTGFSQNPKIIDTLKIHQQIKLFGVDENLLNFNHDFFKSTLFKNDSTLIYNPDGTLHLFEIKLDTSPTVVKLSNSQHHGHNFKRTLFIHDDVIYSYGGEGLFNFSTKLIYFNPKLKGWDEQKIMNYPFDSRKVVNAWKHGSKIMVLLNHHSKYDSNSEYKYIQYTFGEIDLSNFEYKNYFEFKSNDDYGLGLSRGDYVYESDKYLLIVYKTDVQKCRFEIFDKSKGELLKTNLFENMEFPNGHSYIYIKDSTIYYRNIVGLVDSIDINSLKIKDKKNFIQYYRSKVKTNIKFLLIGSIGIISLLFILFLKFKKKKKTKIENNDKKNHEIIEIEDKLKAYKNLCITREELDNLLNISHYSYESIKTKRSLIVNQINERRVIIIERTRKEDDKRFFEYKIN